MRREQSFFEELQIWSEIKLRILEKYLRTYVRKRGSAHRRVFYVDGFAGTGWFGADAASGQEGSPVRVARLAEEIARGGRTYRLVCLNVEQDPGNCALLLDALASFDPSLVRVFPGTFADHLPTLMSLVGSAPAVFFLDPFGPKPVTLDAITPILRRRDTELLINLNTSRLRMMAGFEDSTSRDRAAKLRLVSATLGEDPGDPTPEWLSEWQRRSPLDWEGWAAERYMQRVLDRGAELQFGVTYGIAERYGANPKYHLVFATRHYDAVEIMNDFICAEDGALFDEVASAQRSGQASFLGMIRESEEEVRFRSLVADVLAFIKENPGHTRPEIIRHFVLSRFGQFKKKHYRQAVNACERSD